MVVVDNSCKVPGVVFRNVDVTALGSPSTMTWAGNDCTAFTVRELHVQQVELNNNLCKIMYGPTRAVIKGQEQGFSPATMSLTLPYFHREQNESRIQKTS